jgi:tetratricopeptide (TPR) repeat protein
MGTIQTSLSPLRVALALVFFSVCGTSNAQISIRGGYPTDVLEYDSREVAMLPQYCIYTQLMRDRVPGGNNPAMIRSYYAKFGPTFHALHHYCWGLMKTNRAIMLAKNETTRNFYLQDAVGEFDYVIANATEDFVLMPEILTKKAQNLMHLGKGANAVEHLERAIYLKPDYWPPYAHLGDYYKSRGDLKLAREWFERGLAASPETKALTTRLLELRALEENASKEPRKR